MLDGGGNSAIEDHEEEDEFSMKISNYANILLLILKVYLYISLVLLPSLPLSLSLSLSLFLMFYSSLLFCSLLFLLFSLLSPRPFLSLVQLSFHSLSFPLHLTFSDLSLFHGPLFLYHQSLSSFHSFTPSFTATLFFLSRSLSLISHPPPPAIFLFPPLICHPALLSSLSSSLSKIINTTLSLSLCKILYHDCRFMPQ